VKTPCDNCPFRSDVPAYIHPERGEEIWKALRNDGAFPCHKTVDYGDEDDDGFEGRVTHASQFCAGALILMEKACQDLGGARMNMMVRIYILYGKATLDLDDLDMDAPGFDTVEDWIEHLRKGQ
jgi:hypothetical protein